MRGGGASRGSSASPSPRALPVPRSASWANSRCQSQAPRRSAGTSLPADWHPTIGTFGWILVAFVVANYTYQAAQPFYNAMLPDLVPPEERGRLSGIGTAVGYVGTIVGLLLVAPFFSGALPLLGALPGAACRSCMPSSHSPSHAGRVSTFVPTALLFLLFSLPLFVFCRDHHPRDERAAIAWRAAFADVGHTLRDAKRYPGALALHLRFVSLSGRDRHHRLVHGDLRRQGDGFQAGKRDHPVPRADDPRDLRQLRDRTTRRSLRRPPHAGR